jgi:hypothetical protein
MPSPQTARHAREELDPADEYVANGHRAQDEAPAKEYVLTGHGTHVVDDVAPTLLEAVPAAHWVQLEDPVLE